MIALQSLGKVKFLWENSTLWKKIDVVIENYLRKLHLISLTVGKTDQMFSLGKLCRNNIPNVLIIQNL